MRALLPFLMRVLGFGLFTAALYPMLMALFSIALPNAYTPNIRYPLNSYGHERSRMQDLEQHQPVDIVFIGSSHAYRGFDPRIWRQHGFTSFNLGSSAQSLLQTDLLVEADMPKLSPKLVIMEVHPNPFRADGIESAVDLIANRPIDMHTVGMALRLPNVLTWNALAYGLVRQAIGADERLAEARVRGKDAYIDGGFVERRSGNFDQTGSLKREPAEPMPMQWDAFERALGALREQGVEVILVEAPMTRWYYENGFSGHDAFAQRMAASGRYINMNGKVELSDSLHFFTKGHLNQAGVELFNEALIDTLERRGWLPEPRHR
ncbi:MAG: hypothetical protein IPK70_14055 [Flavobacteriales bacterium]|nr:hypothetical protein [Flavobacteriales bacterium]